jgi:Tol biopolymer transport system component
VRRTALAVALAAAVTALAAAPAHATLAYVAGLLKGHPVVWSAQDDGSSRVKVATGGYNPKVSPDGERVAYLIGARRATLKVKPARGGTAVTVAKNVWYYDTVQWAPDSVRIGVITGRETGPYQLKICNVDAGGCRTIAKGYFQGLSFAPGGEGIAYARAFTDAFPPKANLYVAPLDGGGGADKLTDDGKASSPVWGPQEIAFDRGRTPPRKGDYAKLDIYTINPDGSGLERVTNTNPPFLLAGLQPLGWSASGKRLLAQYTGQDTSEAWRVNANTGKAVDATGGFDGVVGWGISRDGSTLLASTGFFDDPNGDVVAIPWSGGSPTVLAKSATQPSWNR